MLIMISRCGHHYEADTRSACRSHGLVSSCHFLPAVARYVPGKRKTAMPSSGNFI
jgi:hypothetical protein